MKKIKWLIGCSGFHYTEWKEIFYPSGLPRSKWFVHYAQHFNTLEINNTFYRFPQLATLEKWYANAPENFIFSIKVPGTITHFRQFNDTAGLVESFYEISRTGLREKLGCILFQLPPKMVYDPEKFHTILGQMNSSFKNVIEFRHNSWWRREVMEEMTKQKITFCGVSYPGLISDAIINTDTSYYRFHGVPKLYYSVYGQDFLKKILQQVITCNIETAYIYFNNTASAAALENAEMIKKLIFYYQGR